VNDRRYRAWERDLAGLGRVTGPHAGRRYDCHHGTQLRHGYHQFIHAGNGIDDAYREIGTGTLPLVLLQHFRGNGDSDPMIRPHSSHRLAGQGLFEWSRVAG